MRSIYFLLLTAIIASSVGCTPINPPENKNAQLVLANGELQRLKFRTFWDIDSQRCILRNNREEIVLTPYSKTAIIGGRTVEMALPPQINGNDILLSSDFVARELSPLSPPPGEDISFGGSAISNGNGVINKIVIDAGHGGKDTGARGRAALEKNVNLSVARKLQKQLEARGFIVKMTRSGDSYPELGTRTTVSNNFQPDLFVSIHANAVARGKSSTKGYEVLYPDESKSLAPKVSDASAARPVSSTRYAEKGAASLSREQDRFLWNIILEDNRRESKRLAAEIQRSMSASQVGENRGLVPRKDLYILNRTQAPIVLVEIGFISHPSEEKYIASDSGQEKIARAIADGIMNYKNRFEKNGAH